MMLGLKFEKENKKDRRSENYEIIIIGENHIDNYSRRREYEILREVKPVVIFHEGGDFSGEDLENRYNQYLTLYSTICKTCKIIEKLNEKEEDVLPNSMKEIYDILKDMNNERIYLLPSEKIQEYVMRLWTLSGELDENSEFGELIDEINKISDSKLWSILSDPIKGSILSSFLMIKDLQREYGFEIRNIDDNKAKNEIKKLIRLKKSLKDKLSYTEDYACTGRLKEC